MWWLIGLLFLLIAAVAMGSVPDVTDFFTARGYSHNTAELAGAIVVILPVSAAIYSFKKNMR